MFRAAPETSLVMAYAMSVKHDETNVFSTTTL